MLDRQGGEVRVRRQITATSHRREEIEQNVCMANSRVDENRLRASKPRPDARASSTQVEGVIEYLWVRSDTNEPQGRNPRKADAASPIQQRFPPLTRRPMPPVR